MGAPGVTGRNWRQVWRDRSVDKAGTTLGDLIAADGFDAFGELAETAWRGYVLRVAQRMALAPDAAVFEVGCGAGAFLLPLAETGRQVAGVDYSPGLVDLARAALPTARIEVADAAEFATEPRYDAAVANGVFLYFADLGYAAKVVARMLAVSRGGIAILDVPDAAREEETVQARRRQLGEETYRERYAGLPHLYYRRDWFAEAVGAGYQVDVVDQDLQGYAHAPYRYNVFVTRPGSR